MFGVRALKAPNALEVGAPKSMGAHALGLEMTPKLGAFALDAPSAGRDSGAARPVARAVSASSAATYGVTAGSAHRRKDAASLSASLTRAFTSLVFWSSIVLAASAIGSNFVFFSATGGGTGDSCVDGSDSGADGVGFEAGA
jgi:hypothetical protein